MLDIPYKALIIDKNSEGITRRYKSVYSNVEFVTIHQVWLRKIHLQVIIFANVVIIELYNNIEIVVTQREIVVTAIIVLMANSAT